MTEKEETTKSGIILAGSAKEKPEVAAQKMNAPVELVLEALKKKSKK